MTRTGCPSMWQSCITVQSTASRKLRRNLAYPGHRLSRLLQYAKEKGYVKIQIFDPVEDMSHMEQLLVERFHLSEARIASSTLNDEQEIKKYIGLKAAEYLDSIVRDGDIIGVGWGTTLYNMACSLIPRSLKGSQIVQLEGGVTHSKWESYAKDILERFATNYSTIAQYLPLPVIFGTKEVKDMVDQIAISSGCWSLAVMRISRCSAWEPYAERALLPPWLYGRRGKGSYPAHGGR